MDYVSDECSLDIRVYAYEYREHYVNIFPIAMPSINATRHPHQLLTGTILPQIVIKLFLLISLLLQYVSELIQVISLNKMHIRGTCNESEFEFIYSLHISA